MIIEIIGWGSFILAIIILRYADKYALKHGYDENKVDETTYKKLKKEAVIDYIVWVAIGLLIVLITDKVCLYFGSSLFLAIVMFFQTKKHVKENSK